MIFTHTGMVETITAGKKRIPLMKSGKYWKSEEHKFDHNGNSFGSSYAKLYLKTIKPI
ncbi:hypothetical protein R41_240 [Klebsiella phage R4_1]|uniref:Uncharacterized protein n=1 Tax=Klebsiella phage PMBT1 TaxID=1880822 RepID=A0A1G4GQD2_9CAUD|nr:hypothetical protein FDG72_gp197 [Klebsiella phage PMBT1]UUG67215.1 hypothetical protein 4DII_00063 [Klebsiella phage PSKm4DII]UXD79417.1 hypothetical protein OJNDCHOG_00760 [Klebsiella phage 150040]UZO33323.1 hypothetical protein KEKKGBKC_00053 [Klebsiella phage pR7_1]WKC55410.1 hypothetical protein R21_244 [Klebsiella phage R2_1]WKC55687.1 hypothetical protein R41_240 [Klebsiella phage R4_1]WPJ20774.1 hypothetical protein OOGAAMIP_00016 [Klebsiella phage Kp11_Ajakkala-2023]